jgi:hypothetical protein
MPKIYWMSGFNIREGQHTAYKKYLNSKSFKSLCREVESETRIKYMTTYFTIIPSSLEPTDYEAYSFWELPNHAAMDKIRNSEAMGKLAETSYEFVEPRPSKSVVLRNASDVKIMFDPQTKKK